jgi:hypothetical protein
MLQGRELTLLVHKVMMETYGTMVALGFEYLICSSFPHKMEMVGPRLSPGWLTLLRPTQPSPPGQIRHHALYEGLSNQG